MDVFRNLWLRTQVFKPPCRGYMTGAYALLQSCGGMTGVLAVSSCHHLQEIRIKVGASTMKVGLYFLKYFFTHLALTFGGAIPIMSRRTT
jgi:hypothetical protein